jgi:hypothetical protein
MDLWSTDTYDTIFLSVDWIKMLVILLQITRKLDIPAQKLPTFLAHKKVSRISTEDS